MCPPPSSLWKSESFFSTTQLFFPGRAKRPLKGASSVPASLVNRRGRKWACFVGLINNRGWSTHERGCNCYSVEGEERKSLGCSFLRKGASEQAKELWTEGSVCFWIKARCEWGGPLKSEERSRRRNKVGRYKFWLATSKAVITHSHLLTPRGEDSRYNSTAAGCCTWAPHVHLSSSLYICLFFLLSYPISVPKPSYYLITIITKNL